MATNDPYGSVVLADAPTAWFRFDGSTVDETGGTTATANAAPTGYGASLVEGSFGQATLLDGVDDGWIVPTQAKLNYISSFTVEAWVTLTASVSGTRAIVWQSNYQYGLEANALQQMVFNVKLPGSFAFTSVVSPQALTLGQRYHIVAVHSGGFLKLYIDGTLVASTAAGVTEAVTDFSFRIGHEPFGGARWAGSIDDLAVYNKELTAARVAEHNAVGANVNGERQVSLVGAGAAATATGPNGNAVAAIPPGVQAGDVLVAVVTLSRGAAANAAAFSHSVLFNSMQIRNVNNGSTSLTICYGARTHADGDPTSYAFTLDAAELASASITARIFAFRNADQASLTMMGGVAGNASASNAALSASASVPAATLVDNHSGSIALGLVAGHGAAQWTTPALWSVAGYAAGVAPSGGLAPAQQVLVRNYVAAIATTDAATATGTSTTWTAFTIALNAARPPEAGGNVRVRAASMQGVYTGQTDFRVPKPRGTLTNDLLVMAIGTDQGVPHDTAITSGLSGWTRFLLLTTADCGDLALYWKYAAAGEPTGYAFTKPSGVDVTAGIVALTNAGPPLAPVSTQGISSSPSIPAITVPQAGSMLLGVVMAGDNANAYRQLLPPAGMIERVDERPTINGGWQDVAIFSEHRAASGSTGARTSTLQVQTSPTASPAWTALSNSWAGVAVVVPPGGSGAVALSASGQLSFGSAAAAVAGTLARTASATLASAPAAASPGVKGALTLSAAGALTLASTPRPVAALALSGSGSLALAATPRPAAALAMTSSSVLLLAGGGAVGNLQLTAAGQAAFAVTPRPAASLALSASGALALLQSAVTAQGSLARTAAAALTFPIRLVAMRGNLALSASGSLGLAMSGFTTVLRKWSGAAWVPTLVQKWTGAAWVLAAVRRLLSKAALAVNVGPLYSSGEGPAGVFSQPYGRGPTDQGVYRMTRTATADPGWGAYIAADLLPAAGPVPAGTWFEVVWWERSSSDVGTQSWQPVNDPATLTVAVAQAYPRSTEWRLRRFTAQALIDWQPGVHRFRTQVPSVPAGAWVEISDPQLRVWA